MITGVEIHHVRRRFIPFHPVDLIEQRNGFLVGFVDDDDPSPFPERHVPVAIVPSPAGAELDGKGIDLGPHSVSHREKIPDRTFNRGNFNPFPINP